MDTTTTDEQTEPETQPEEDATTGEAAEDVTADAAPAPSEVLSGGAAVVGAGLGLASLTGTWFGTVMSAHKELLGQIKSQSAPPAEQIVALYRTPWHTTAVVNGVFALAAILVAVIVLLWPRLAASAPTAPWVKAVAWGAVALGVIGLLIAGAVWFDLFTAMPDIPSGPPAPGQ